ncbi:MAG: rhombosortase [Planctomycetota bacterium]
MANTEQGATIDRQPWPLVTIGVLLFSVATHLVPPLAGALEFDRGAVASGQLWRLLTGHATHYGGEHLLWDGAVLAVLGAVCERAGRGRFLGLMLTSALGISLGVWLAAPGMQFYRGLSGIDSALFAWVTARWTIDGWGDRNWPRLAAGVLPLLGFAGKCCYECVAGVTLFVDSSAAAFTPAPLAHLLGGVVGVAFAGVLRRGVRPVRRPVAADRASAV